LSSSGNDFVDRTDYKKDSNAAVVAEVGKPTKKETEWFANLDELQKYKQLNGDCIIPRSYLPNPRLGAWVR
jgi:hypothetical protein